MRWFVAAESVRDPAGDDVHRRHAGGQKSCGGVDATLAVAISMPHCIDPDGALARTARGLGICVGDG